MQEAHLSDDELAEVLAYCTAKARGWGSNLGRGRWLSEELQAEAYAGVAHALATYQESKGGSLAKWCRVSATNAIKEYMRSQVSCGFTMYPARRLRAYPTFESTDYLPPAQDKRQRQVDEMDGFGYLLAPLTKREKQVITSLVVEGYTLRETGERIGVTESRAYQIQHKSYEKIRAYLDYKRQHDRRTSDTATT